MSCLARPTSVLIGILVTAALTGAQPHHHGTPTDNIGHVSLTTSCTPAVTEEFNRGVALLHSFWFPEAIRSFDRVLEQDPGCAMAWWGKAMSYWGNPYASSRPAEALKNGATAVVQARALQPPTARERAYVEAVAQLYEHHESRPNGQRTLAYEQAMAALHARYPDDSEAAIFYALALTQTAAPTDKSYANLKAAGAILEQQLSAQPDHPGITHYIIHSYDVPALAEKALEAARRYARIAPAVPHALHMP